jgi:hypothetical protein
MHAALSEMKAHITNATGDDEFAIGLSMCIYYADDYFRQLTKHVAEKSSCCDRLTISKPLARLFSGKTESNAAISCCNLP